MAPSRVVGTAESAGNRYSWCIGIYHTRNVMVWEADFFFSGLMCSPVLLSSPLFQVLAKANGQKHTRWVMDAAIWPGSRGRSAEKAKSSISWDFYLSVQTWGLGRGAQISSCSSRLKKVKLLLWVGCAGVAVLHHWFGAFRGLHMWWRHLISPWLLFLL